MAISEDVCVDDGYCAAIKACPSFERVTIHRSRPPAERPMADLTAPPPPDVPRAEGPYRVHLAGVGGMGIGVAGRILIEAAAGEWPEVEVFHRKGMAQRSHDYFSIPLCMKCHIPGIHKLGGFFAGWTREQANEWEAEQVRIHRNRYAMQAPEPAKGAPLKRVRGVDVARETAAERERRRIAAWLRDKAGARHLKVNEAAVLTDAASELEQQTGEF